MIEEVRQYEDLAIILTWPDATIRGDEKWMMFFKKIGIVKNLNFKVGHTGVVIVKRATGEMLFYDFGRYITPRGYGRARSKFSDPRLSLDLKAEIKDQQITNMQEIASRFEDLKGAMYGEGKLYFAIADKINFEAAKSYGDACVDQGTFPYGALAKRNNNCSRFITRMLMKASQKYAWYHGINFPETLKASPISNVVNAQAHRMIYAYTPEVGLTNFKMNRWQSFMFLIKQLADNVNLQKSKLLPDDLIIGKMNYDLKPTAVPENAQYLGGVGDGAWYALQQVENNHILISRHTSKGLLEYMVAGIIQEPFDSNKPYYFTYDSHLLFTHILQDGRKIRVKHTENLILQQVNYKDAQERYA